jgi:sugar/nucleoside kinase (ribokinase family)
MPTDFWSVKLPPLADPVPEVLVGPGLRRVFEERLAGQAGVLRSSIVILGDLRVEMRSQMPSVSFAHIREDQFCIAPITMHVAGTAVNMASHAVRHFGSVDVIAGVGSDAGSSFITEALARIPAEWHLVCKDLPNGYLVIVRDSTEARSDGCRLLISGAHAPVGSLVPDDLDSLAFVIQQADVLFVDGYPLVSGSGAALRRAISLARDSRTVVCFDLVPHNIDSLVDHDDLRALIAQNEVVISEARTLSRIYGNRIKYPAASRDLPDLLQAISDAGESPRYLIIRYGENDISSTAICQAGRVLMSYETGYAASPDPVGFGDRLASAELAALLAHDLVARQP